MLETGITWRNACIVSEGLFVLLLVVSAFVPVKMFAPTLLVSVLFFLFGGVCLWIDTEIHGE